MKVIISSNDSDAEQGYEDACAAAETEAKMMALAEKGIDCQELMVKLYDIAKGPLPAHLVKFGVPDENVVGLVMRYEAGGTLHALLHPDKKSPRMPPSLADQLRYMKDIAACLTDLHLFGDVAYLAIVFCYNYFFEPAFLSVRNHTLRSKNGERPVIPTQPADDSLGRLRSSSC